MQNSEGRNRTKLINAASIGNCSKLMSIGTQTKEIQELSNFNQIKLIQFTHDSLITSDYQEF